MSGPDEKFARSILARIAAENDQDEMDMRTWFLGESPASLGQLYNFMQQDFTSPGVCELPDKSSRIMLEVMSRLATLQLMKLIHEFNAPPEGEQP